MTIQEAKKLLKAKRKAIVKAKKLQPGELKKQIAEFTNRLNSLNEKDHARLDILFQAHEELQ